MVLWSRVGDKRSVCVMLSPKLKDNNVKVRRYGDQGRRYGDQGSDGKSGEGLCVLMSPIVRYVSLKRGISKMRWMI